MVVRLIDALDCVANWRTRLSAAVITGRNKSRATAIENKQANALMAQRKMAADLAAQAALDASFDAEDQRHAAALHGGA